MQRVFFLLISFVLVACGDSNNPAEFFGETAVRYEVLTGGCTASVTYENRSGNTEQRTVDNGWTYDFNAKSGAFLYVSAQNDCDSGGVSANIYEFVDFEGYRLTETATSNGAFVIATASKKLD